MRSFERVVRVREIWEKQSRIQLGEANRHLREAQEDVAEAADDHREAVAATPERATGADLDVWRMAAMATSERHRVAADLRVQAEDRAKAAQGAWRRASQQADMARSLEERRQQARAYAARRAAEAALNGSWP